MAHWQERQETDGISGMRRPIKSAGAFRTISEVAGELDVPQHVLRFWETRFNQIRPLKRAGGRRYYRPEDVDLLRRIRELLYKHGYTIKGVQKLLRDTSRLDEAPGASRGESAEVVAAPAPVVQAASDFPSGPAVNALDLGAGANRAAIDATIFELTALRDLLRARRR